MKHTPFSIALMAGGQSKRMGTDKGLLPFMGRPMALYILDQVANLSEDIFIVSNRPDAYHQMTDNIYPDKIAGIGALGGIHSALVYAQHALCLVLACDMPFVSKDLTGYLVERTERVDAVIPDLGGNKLEPFRALYRQTCLPVIEAAIEAGQRKAVSFLPQVKATYISKAELERLNPSLDSFLNINTPEDLVEAEAYARQLAQGEESA